MADKKVKALAIAGSNRSALMPYVPTMAETGYPKVELSPWFGLVAPAGTPDFVIQKLHQEFVKAANHPELIRTLGEDAIELHKGTPEQFAALIASDRERLKPVIRAVGTHSK